MLNCTHILLYVHVTTYMYVYYTVDKSRLRQVTHHQPIIFYSMSPLQFREETHVESVLGTMSHSSTAESADLPLFFFMFMM